MLKPAKLCALMLSLCLLTMVLTCCDAREEADDQAELHIYVSFYPIYALAEMICVGVPDLHLHLLIQPQDGCIRSYALSDWDAALLANADALIVGGEGLESFADALVNTGTLAVAQVLDGVECLEIKAENADADNYPHWQGANPHAYMSVDGAIDIAARIAAAMVNLDPRYEAMYQSNLEMTQTALEGLRGDIEAEVASVAGMKCAVLNEALVYTARDCGLDVSLCWARESGEDVDAGELERLLAMLKARDISLVLTERQAPASFAKALRDAGLRVASLDVLSTHSAADGSAAYFEAMLNNARLVHVAYDSLAQEGS